MMFDKNDLKFFAGIACWLSLPFAFVAGLIWFDGGSAAKAVADCNARGGIYATNVCQIPERRAP